MNIKQILAFTLALVLVTAGGCAASGQSRSTGEVIDDSSIGTRTKTALLADDLTDGLNIDVEVNRNKVQLNGFVDSQAQIDRAGEIARSITGVDSVHNNLKVSDGGKRMTGEYIDDKSLEAKVKAALIDDPLAPSMQIDVKVNRGEVSLGGYVDTSTERDAAVDITRRVEGVTVVHNNLTVR